MKLIMQLDLAVDLAVAIAFEIKIIEMKLKLSLIKVE
jgi:hypothetical protein